MYLKKVRGGSSDDDARALHQLAVALCTSVRTRFIVELGAGWLPCSESVAVPVVGVVATLLEVHLGGAAVGHLAGGSGLGSVSHVDISRRCSRTGGPWR